MVLHLALWKERKMINVVKKMKVVYVQRLNSILEGQ